MVARPSLTMVGVRSPVPILRRIMPRLTVTINRSRTRAVVA